MKDTTKALLITAGGLVAFISILFYASHREREAKVSAIKKLTGIELTGAEARTVDIRIIRKGE